MSQVSVVASSVDSQGAVSADLVDAAVEAVMLSPDPRARSAVLYSLVSEMCAAVASLHGDETTMSAAADMELISAGRLVAAARDHHWRMAFLQISPSASDAR